MKSASNNSLLDNFLKDTLQVHDPDLQPIDWSEVDVLLRHEQKSLPVFENKKVILITGVSVVSLILLFGIFKIVQYFASLPAETEKVAIPIQSPIKKISDSSASVIKTAKIGSSFVNEENDTSSSISDIETIPLKNITTVVKPIQKQEKKKKPDTLLSTIDTSTERTKMEEFPMGDTTSKHPFQETKNETPFDVDTARKKFSLWPKKSKNKKNIPDETKLDSLKQK